MIMAALKLDFNLTETDLSDIFCTAAMSIGYWADECEISEPYEATDPATTLAVTCEEGTELYELKMDDVIDSIERIVNGEVTVADSIKSDILKAITEDDYGYIDGYAADAIVQAACFGELIYG